MHLKTTKKKARVEPKTKEPVNPSEQQDRDPKDRAEKLLLADIKNIQSFDLNKDGKIDKTELKEAAKVASKWAISSLVNSKNWFYYGAGKPVGPMNWEEIDKISKKYNDVFVSFSDIGTESRLKFWLPAKIIKQIQKPA